MNDNTQCCERCVTDSDCFHGDETRLNPCTCPCHTPRTIPADERLRAMYEQGKFDARMEALTAIEEAVEGMKRTNEFMTGEVCTNTDYQRVGEHMGYNAALTDVLTTIRRIMNPDV